MLNARIQEGNLKGEQLEVFLKKERSKAFESIKGGDTTKRAPVNIKNVEQVDTVDAAISELPSVHHYSWFDIERKIKTYSGFWSRHWQSLYNIDQEDTSENNMFFDKSWTNVSDQEIKDMAENLNIFGAIDPGYYKNKTFNNLKKKKFYN